MTRFLLRLEMPGTVPTLRGGKLMSWQKQLGDRIAFGDELVTVAMDDFAVLRRTARATLLAGRRGSRLRSDLESRSERVAVNVIVTASESGTLSEKSKQVGDFVAVGDLLGMVETDPDDLTHNLVPNGSVPVMRVISNVANDEGPFQ
jgi:hypothetical protein